ncbi:MAG: endonuclease [Paludibacteraceae bacterium]|nr:endonuclease [Paludibacteraceae bacterium]
MKTNCYLLSVICSLLAILCPLSARATIPDGYYSTIDGKKGDAICEALHAKIKAHESLGYDNLYSMYQTSDMTPQGYIWDMYSTCNFENPGDKCGSYRKVCDCFNREHSIPASWFGDANPMYCDPFHVVPTDGFVNNQRGNYPLGECANGERLSGGSLCKLGSSTFSGYSGTVFEVDDQYKGDFARAYFYMVTCYRDKDFTKKGGGPTMFTYSGGKAGFTSYTINLMLKWHRLDPVSQKEIVRNDAIYARQKNRNPFIDYPCLAEYIWGQYKSETLDMATVMPSSDSEFMSSDRTGCNCSANVPTLLTPKQSVSLAVGSASVGESVSLPITVSGTLLEQTLTCTITGTNASMFHFANGKSSMTLSADAVNLGVTINVTYAPTATGNHTATLTISSPELKSARTVTLTGKSEASLVSPATGSEYTFVASGVKDIITQQITVKGTNLILPLYVGIANGSGAFSVSPSSISAAQANAGTTVTVTYAPKTLGETSAKLIINSNDFNQPSITLRGECIFELENPSPVTANSATLHWTDAGVESYLVDVFFLTQEEEKEVVILNDNAGGLATKVAYFDNATSGYIRLGSGSKGGSISYSGLDLSKGAQLTITAKAYNSKDDPVMKVYINGKLYSQELTTSDVAYTFDIEEGVSSQSTIKIESSAGNQRFYVKNVKVTAGGTKEVRTSLPGYPREETYLSHTVSNLTRETEYSYQVTPKGQEPSEIETFTTTETTDIERVENGTDATSSPAKFLNGDGHLLLRTGRHLYSAHGLQLR